MYVFWAVLSLHCCTWLSLVAAIASYCLAAMHRLLIAVASLVAVHRRSCSVAYEIFLNQGLNLCPLHWQVDSQPLNH